MAALDLEAADEAGNGPERMADLAFKFTARGHLDCRKKIDKCLSLSPMGKNKTSYYQR